MPDYGHDLLFGTFLTPTAAHPQNVIALAQLTEQVGLDLVTIQDHPYQSRFLDTWTLLSVIAVRTRTVRVAPNVANLPLRPPAVLARSVATLDLLSGGRVELGLGAGAFPDAIAALGGARLSPRQSVDALEEGLAIIRAMWSTGERSVRVDGHFHRVTGAHPGPAPAHPVEIWLGAYKPRMLALTGRAADGWLPSSSYAGPDDLPAMTAAIDAAAEDAGRRPSEVRRLYNIGGTFTTRESGFLQGPASTWVEQLAQLCLTEGMSAYLLMSDSADDIRRFAAEVVPALREIVLAERSASEPPEVPVDPPHHSTAHPHDERATTGGQHADLGTLPERLGVTPTPDDGERLSSSMPWDETTRPSGPPPDASHIYTSHEQAAGRHLVDVHDHLRGELQQLREIVDQVAAGQLDPALARSHINAMTIRQNNWTMGAYCASYCRVVATHHAIEDQSVFPHLRRSDSRLAPVIDRLQEEHVVIHDVLEGVDRALVQFITGASSVDELRGVVDLLTDTLLSHLSYEERELVEPLARLGFY